jgi:hypothetical protein
MTRTDNGVITFTDTHVLYQTDETMDDFVTPGYASKVKRGAIINNDCSYVKTTVDAPPGGYSLVLQNGHYLEVSGSGNLTRLQYSRLPSYMASPPILPVLPGHHVQAACASALGNINRSPYAFGEDVAEWRETLRFLRNPWQSLRTLNNKMQRAVRKKRRWQKKSRPLDFGDWEEFFSGLWNEYRFAASPLVRSANDALASYFDNVKRPERRIARGKSVQPDFFQRSTKKSYGYRSWATSQQTYNVRAGVMYEVTNPTNDWRYKYGLGFKDIPETLWAIMPYSFMIDRLVNISQAIRGWTAFLDPNVRILTAWYTKRWYFAYNRCYMGYVEPHGKSQTISMTPDEWLEETFHYDRKLWYPSLSDSIPRLDLGYLVSTTDKVADLYTVVLRRFLKLRVRT